MNNAEYTRIMKLFESHLQVKKLASTGTIRLYLHSVYKFYNFCHNFKKDIVLPEKWNYQNLGVRELEIFLNHQIKVVKLKRSTLVTIISGIKSFFSYLAESQHLQNNPIQYFKLPRDLSEIGKQRFDIFQINNLFQNFNSKTLKGIQQRLLLELIYGLGMSLSKISEIKSIIPELDHGSIRIYSNKTKYVDYPFNQSAIGILKSYLKLIDSIEGVTSFWVNKKGNKINSGQLYNLIKQFFESNNMPAISINELQNLSVQHFYQEGADIRSMQTLRKFKHIRRLQTLSGATFDHLKDLIRQKHIRSNKT